MADKKLYIIDQDTGDLFPIRLVDPGDGSGYSIATYGGASGSSGDVLVHGTFTDRSGTIAVGNTAQALMASNINRLMYVIQNLSSGDIYVSFVGTAVLTQPSIRIPAGAMLTSSGVFVSTQAISIIGATTGQVFTAYEA